MPTKTTIEVLGVLVAVCTQTQTNPNTASLLCSMCCFVSPHDRILLLISKWFLSNTYVKFLLREYMMVSESPIVFSWRGMLLSDVCNIEYFLSQMLLFFSPEHPSFRARGRSMLSGDRKSFRDYADDMASSRFLPLYGLILLYV